MIAIIQLAHSLEMTVVAEGVETASQHHELTRLGSDYCQGFYFARPMLPANLNTLIQHQAQSTDAHLPALAASAARGLPRV